MKFTFNRNEQIVILLLSAALLAGGVVSLLDRYMPGGVPDFEIRKGAVAVPSDTARTDPLQEASHAPIDLNRASVQDLQRLPGIGPKVARRIVDYREQHGPFGRLEEIAAVRGIGVKTVDRLRPLTTVTRP